MNPSTMTYSFTVISTIILVLPTVTQAQTTITRSSSSDSSDVNCGDTYSNCLINCNAYKSCTGNIICPTNGDYCEINCKGESSCQKATIYSQSTQKVLINFDDEDYTGYDATVYAPDNGGDLTIRVLESWEGFRYGKIWDADGTNSITLMCDQSNRKHSEFWGAYADCSYMTIDASEAQYLNVSIKNGADFYTNDVFCPAYSDYKGTSCYIDCSDTDSCGDTKVYAVNGIPEDIRYYCQDSSYTSCEYDGWTGDYPSYIYCDSSYNSYCQWKRDSSSGYTWYCDDRSGSCNNPTSFPTSSPTNPPSTDPTYRPTKSPIEPGAPTQEPSISPSKFPTEQPVLDPTAIPTIQPTDQPSVLPTITVAAPPTNGGQSIEVVVYSTVVYDSITFFMNVQSNLLATLDLSDENIKNAFVESVRDSFYYITSTVDSTVDLVSLDFDLIITDRYDNNNIFDNSGNNNDGRRRRSLLQTATDATTSYDYDIIIEWRIDINSETADEVINPMIESYSLNMSNFIELRYFGFNQAIVTIYNINGELDTQDTGNTGNTDDSGDSDKSTKKDSGFLGLSSDDSLIYLIASLVGGFIITCLCCFAFFAFIRARNKRQLTQNPNKAAINLGVVAANTENGNNLNPNTAGGTNHRTQMQNVPSAEPTMTDSRHGNATITATNEGMNATDNYLADGMTPGSMNINNNYYDDGEGSIGGNSLGGGITGGGGSSSHHAGGSSMGGGTAGQVHNAINLLAGNDGPVASNNGGTQGVRSASEYSNDSNYNGNTTNNNVSSGEQDVQLAHGDVSAKVNGKHGKNGHARVASNGSREDSLSSSFEDMYMDAAKKTSAGKNGINVGNVGANGGGGGNGVGATVSVTLGNENEIQITTATGTGGDDGNVVNHPNNPLNMIGANNGGNDLLDSDDSLDPEKGDNVLLGGSGGGGGGAVAQGENSDNDVVGGIGATAFAPTPHN